MDLASNWRLGVDTFMHAYSDWRLAARVTELTALPTILVDRGVPGMGFAYLFLGFDQLPIPLPFGFMFPVVGRFPWGIEVEPD